MAHAKKLRAGPGYALAREINGCWPPFIAQRAGAARCLLLEDLFRGAFVIFLSSKVEEKILSRKGHRVIDESARHEAYSHLLIRVHMILTLPGAADVDGIVC